MKTFLVALLSTTTDIRTVRDGRVVETHCPEERACALRRLAPVPPGGGAAR